MNAAMNTLQQPGQIGAGVGGMYPGSLAGMGTATGGALNELMNFLQNQQASANYNSAVPQSPFGPQEQQPMDNSGGFSLLGPSQGGFMGQ